MTKLFRKENEKNVDGLFVAERKGIEEIASGFGDYHMINTPKIHTVTEQYIEMDFIEEEKQGEKFWALLAKELATMHKLMVNTQFGLDYDNFIGPTPQINTWEIDWPSFFMKHRLLAQINLVKNKVHKAELSKIFLDKSDSIEKILSAIKVTPVLVHGDLWYGNIICGRDQSIWVIDPAIYYGHFEVDLAMSKLFGGFHPSFYEEYNKVNPLAEGHEERFEIYNLYHVLNHFNIFGGSYYNHALKILNSIS